MYRYRRGCGRSWSPRLYEYIERGEMEKGRQDEQTEAWGSGGLGRADWVGSGVWSGLWEKGGDREAMRGAMGGATRRI